MTDIADTGIADGAARDARRAARAAAGLRSVRRQAPFATARVVAALMLREMASTYGRTPVGYGWALVEPLGGILVMSVVFSILMRQPQLGENFIMFYATGLMPYNLYSNVSARVANSLSYSNRLLSYPRVTIIDALLARFLLNVLLQGLISYLVISTIMLLTDTGTQLEMGPVLLGFSMAAALAFGMGTLNCFLGTRFPLWGAVWGVLTRPLLFLSGVLILVESVPDPYGDWLKWNPLSHVVAEVREGFYYGYDPRWVDPAYTFLIALAAGAVGLLFLWRYYRDILEA